MRILELFAGYGSQALALENLGIDFTSDISEIDKYAIQAYNQLHGETHNWGDINKIDERELPYYDLITYSSPCQDFSTAGKQKGGDKGSGTRSSLLWECERIIRAVKPKYLLMENVKNLVGKKHIHNFTKWLKTLEMMGYWNFWQVLNAKDYGVPQNRERVFVVSIRKDIDTKGYKFPEKIPLEKRLKDILEPVVDEKYYLSADKVGRFLQNGNTNPSGKGMNGNVYTGDICNTLTTNKGEGLKIKEVSNTIRCGGGSSLDGKHTWDIVVEPLCTASRGRNPENPSTTAGSPTEQRLEINNTGCSNTLTSVQKDNQFRELTSSLQKLSCEATPEKEKLCYMWETDESFRLLRETLSEIQEIWQSSNIKPQKGYRIRKLTARECWRLMGVKDEQFDRLHGISNTQLYKLAGNSIVVDVLMAIFKNLFLSDDGTKGQLTLF